MPNSSEKYRNEPYWLSSVLPWIDIADAYDIEEDVLTADELLERWSMFEPYELALAINDEIRCRKHGPHSSFPITYLLCKSRINPETGRNVHFLRFSYDLFPFTYTWSGDTLSFDFTGIVFKKFHVINFEYNKSTLLLQRDRQAPKSHNQLTILREQFPISGIPQPTVETLAACEPVPTNASSKKKDMDKATKAHRDNSNLRWKEQFAVGVAAAVFCMDKYQSNGKPVEKKEYEAALREMKMGQLMDEADRIFRKLMPRVVLNRGS